MLQTVVDVLYDIVWTYGIPIGGGQYIPWVVLLLLGAGIYFTLRLAFVQIWQLPHGVAVTSGAYDHPDDPGDVSHFQALTTALSATLGIGNIAGAALAIHVGGPGALFWMWMTGILGMATKYSEVTIAQFYRNVDEPTEEERGTWQQTWKGTVAGGPMFYIEKGLGKNWKPLAIFFAVMLMITSFLTGNAVQANTVADVMNSEFGVAVWISGIVLAAVIALVILGGVTAIGRVTGILVPIMAALYVTGTLFILAFNYTQVLPTLGSIFTNAFNPSAGVAGTGAGAFLLTFTYGVQRGLFSNEAGMGSAPIAHSAAKTNEPASEGVVALLEPFIDTITVVTLTCLAILVSGAWGNPVPTQFELNSGNVEYRVEEEGGIFPDSETPEEIRIEDGRQQVQDPNEDPQFSWRQAVVDRFYTSCASGCETEDDLQDPFTGTLYPSKNVAVAEDGTTYEVLYGQGVRSGAPLTRLAFERGLSPLGDWGGYIVILSVLLFAISTSISWSYYGDRCAYYLFGERSLFPYKVVFVLMNFTGAVTALTTIWTIGDIALGIVIVPNLIAVLMLTDKVKEVTDDYLERKPWMAVTQGEERE
ncbi:MAG: sodium:alanine symporter family protein [Bacteroidetes bacterium QS_3_64_15]|nr:MAG: sodium:alanine symporter family protein [Bacteroidetes bacterium QS_3_64_15]